MKKKFTVIIAIALISVTVALAAVACQKQEEGYNLVLPDGAPALSVACLDEVLTTNDTEYKLNKKIVSSLTLKNEAEGADIAIVPANMAAVFYNKGIDVKLIAVVTKGNLFALSSMQTQADSLSDMVGKLVYSIGQSSVPDIIFKTLLKDSGLRFAVGDKAEEGQVTIKYCSNGSEVNAKLLLAKQRGEQAYGVLAEPDVQKGKAAGLNEVFDVQKLWGERMGDGANGYAQAVLIAKSSVCSDPEFIAKLLGALGKNKGAVFADPALAEENIKKIYPQTSLSGNLSQVVIERCNLDVLDMKDGRSFYENTLKAIVDIDAKLIGGKLPDDGFYYFG